MKRYSLQDLKTMASEQPAMFLQLIEEFGNRFVRIWSAERGAYWSQRAQGYCVAAYNAGMYTLNDAIKLTKHCGPEKGIEYIPLSETK